MAASAAASAPIPPLPLLLLLLLLLCCCRGQEAATVAAGGNRCPRVSFVYSAADADTGCRLAPPQWSRINSWCHDRQPNRPSPIAIRLAVCHEVAQLASLRLSGSWWQPRNFRVRNNGHTLQADALSSDLTVSGGSLNGMYTAVQFHFHWGSAANMAKGVGSEHVMFDKDGRRVATPAEVHIVCRRSDLSFSEAAATADGIAVLGAFIGSDGAVSEDASSAIVEVTKDFEAVEAPGNSSTFVEASLRLRSLLPANLDRFVGYDGAFTTPGCNPVVQWRVFTDLVSVHRHLLLKFTETFFDEERTRPMWNNFRPVMQLHGRTVRCRFIH